jgi:putative Mn2+ efflux pump MntP
LSLSLNAVAGGFGASLSGYKPLFTSGAIGVFSYLTIAAGQQLAGTYFSKWLGGLAHRVAGLVLIGVGMYELFF